MASYFIDDSDYLEHYGVMGMKWGVRKSSDRPSRSIRRMAKRDAKKVAKAKAGYGVGSGTSRRLLDAQVKQRSNTSEGYKKAYKEAYEKLPHDKYAAKAEKRHLKDIKVANRNQATNKRIAKGGAILGGVLGVYAAYKINSLDKLNYHEKRVLGTLAVSGSMSLGSAYGAMRERATNRARRKLDYRY